MSGRRQHHEEHVDESWLIPYGDLMTLLLALFIVLFASGNVDATKYQAIMQSFYSEFNGGMLPQNGGANLIPDGGILLPADPDDDDPSPTPSPSPSPGTGVGLPDPQLQALFNSLTGYVAANDLSGNMKLSLSAEGVLITLSSDVWFASGSAALTPSMREFAATLSNLLIQNQHKEQPLNIIITGHTDNRPIATVAFRSNWHLSVARAVNFMEVMLNNPGFDPRHFSARGYGEYEPIDTNSTDIGRQRNRRVEVLVTLRPLTAPEPPVPPVSAQSPPPSPLPSLTLPS